MGLNLYVLLGGVVTILGSLLAAFFVIRSDGKKAQENEDLKKDVAADEEKLGEAESSNSFRNRIITDAGFRKRVLDELGNSKDK